jgi:hypothetical protein
MRTVTWVKNDQNQWLEFLGFKLSDVRTFGVYIIWHAGQTPYTVYVGHGNIRERLLAHTFDSRILGHLSKGLYVTWAEVPSNEAKGVESFLADQLRPLVEAKHANVKPIPVNFPSAA